MPSDLKKARAGAKVGQVVGKAGTKVGARAGRRLAPHAGRAAWKAGKVEAKLIRRALASREPRGQRYLKYGLFVAAGIAIGALLSRSKGESNPTWGGAAGDAAGSANRYSTPASGPLIGSTGGGVASEAIVPEQQEEVEQRIRSELGQDERTKDLPRVNVEVNDGVAELRGSAPNPAAKQAAGEIAAATEGVSEVRNLLTVG